MSRCWYAASADQFGEAWLKGRGVALEEEAWHLTQRSLSCRPLHVRKERGLSFATISWPQSGVEGERPRRQGRRPGARAADLRNAAWYQERDHLFVFVFPVSLCLSLLAGPRNRISTTQKNTPKSNKC